MQTSIVGTDPKAIPEVEEAAFALARLNEQARALKLEIKKAESVLISRLDEFNVPAYSGVGVRAFIDESRKAKVEVDGEPDEDRPRRRRNALDDVSMSISTPTASVSFTGDELRKVGKGRKAKG